VSVTERVPLSRERILRAAVELVDANGLGALSMRKLGAALGVEAMSLYNHVANKDAVVDGLLEALLQEVELPPRDRPWDEQIRVIALQCRKAGHAHPAIFPLFGSRPVQSMDAFAPFEQTYGALRLAGFDPPAALDAFMAVASYVFGFTLAEVGGLVSMTSERPIDLDGFDAADHPYAIEMAAVLLQRDADQQFSFGLEQLLRGLAAMLA